MPRSKFKPLVAALALALLVGSAYAATYPSIVRLTGSMGEFDIQLLDAWTPKTATNFVGYVQRGDFNNSIIHRSVPGFVVQGGGFTLQSNLIVPVPTQPPVTNEPRFQNLRGTVAMAKEGGNPHSATSQWFINLADNSTNLNNQNGGFTVFGVVLGNGMAVADAIAALPFYNASLWLGPTFSNLPLRNPSLDSSNFVLFSSVRRMATGTQVFPFDFVARDERFTAGFADLPANDNRAQYVLRSGRTNLPSSLVGTNNFKALFISGVNRSDDLWMFWKRKAIGLRPETVYEATFDLELATAAAAGTVGIGGAPGESVFLKAGASAIEPRVVTDAQGWLRMNVDKGNQSQPGVAASVLGHAAKPDDGNTNYVVIRRDNRSSRIRATTAADGSLWLFFGSDSGFEGTTSLYYTSFTAVLEPLGKVQKITFAPANQIFGANKTFPLVANNSSRLPLSFSSSDSNIVAVSSNVATIKGVGSVTITATNSGNSQFYPAGLARTISITKASQSIRPFPAVKTIAFGTNLVLTNTNSTANLPVTFTLVSGPAVLSGNTLQVTNTGNVVVRATQLGDAFYTNAPALTKTFAAVKAKQTIAFTNLPTTIAFTSNGVIPLSATASSGLPVSYASGNTNILQILGSNSALMRRKGTVTITASQLGNGNYNAAPKVARNIVIN